MEITYDMIEVPKNSLYLKAFGYGSGEELISHHNNLTLEQTGHVMLRRASTAEQNNEQELQLRASCVGDTFNYVVSIDNESDADRALNYVLDSYFTEWPNNLLCFKILKNIKLLDLNKLDETKLNSILDKFIGRIEDAGRIPQYYDNIMYHLKNLTTGKFFDDEEFLSLIPIDKAKSIKHSTEAIYYHRQILKLRLLFLFKFIYGINITLRDQYYFLNKIKEWKELEGSSYKTNMSINDKFYGHSLASELKYPENKLYDWVKLMLNVIIQKTTVNPVLLNTKNNRCSYNGLDQIFCLVTCQTDFEGLNYVARDDNILPDVGNEIVFLTDKYVTGGDHNNLLEPVYTYEHNKEIGQTPKLIFHTPKKLFTDSYPIDEFGKVIYNLQKKYLDILINIAIKKFPENNYNIDKETNKLILLAINNISLGFAIVYAIQHLDRALALSKKNWKKKNKKSKKKTINTKKKK